MGYCKIQDLIERFGNEELVEISDHENTGERNDVAVQQAIDDANAEIDGYLAGRYQLPMENPPQILAKVACDISRYNLYDEGATEAIEKRYNDAIRYLRSAAKGEVSLGVVQGAEVQGASHSLIVSDRKIFSRKNSGFI